MKARIVRIGNSQGVRLPKLLLEQAGLPEDIEIHAEAGRIVIEAAQQPRAGWAAAASAARAAGDDALLEEGATTRFDVGEWEWR
jgi:antitoxin MazE